MQAMACITRFRIRQRSAWVSEMLLIRIGSSMLGETISEKLINADAERTAAIKKKR